MITLGFDTAAAIILSVAVLLVFGVWLCERASRRPKAAAEDDEARNIRQCPYCRRLCVDDARKKVLICPVCKSYFDEETL
jgi:hypothetical protein